MYQCSIWNFFERTDKRRFIVSFLSCRRHFTVCADFINVVAIFQHTLSVSRDYADPGAVLLHNILKHTLLRIGVERRGGLVHEHYGRIAEYDSGRGRQAAINAEDNEAY